VKEIDEHVFMLKHNTLYLIVSQVVGSGVCARVCVCAGTGGGRVVGVTV
jgi:hypothetical protein